MGWKFELESQLARMNESRQREGRRPLTWQEVGKLIGIEYKSLLNLARNSTLRATNTRFLDSLCAFFCCDPNDIMKREPELARREPDHEEVDRLLEIINQGEQEQPKAFFHVDTLYGSREQEQWRRRRRPRRIRR